MSGTKRARISSVSRIRQGADGAACSPGSRPSLSQRRIVNSETPRSLAAWLMVTSSECGSGGGAAGMSARWRAEGARARGDALAGGAHARRGERQSGPGGVPVAGEDRGDLVVGVIGGEAPDQLDGVLGQ